MGNSGIFWVLLFFALIVIAIIKTADLQPVGYSLHAQTKTQDGRSIPSFITVAATQPEPLPQTGLIFQHFTYKPADKIPETLCVDVDKLWLLRSGVGIPNVTIYWQQQAGNEWQPQPIINTIIYADAVTYVLGQPQEGNYLLLGSPEQKKRLTLLSDPRTRQILIYGTIGVIILVAALTILIKRRNQQQHDTADQDVDAYVKRALLEGKDEETIRQTLISAGWTKEKIDQCLRRARFF